MPTLKAGASLGEPGCSKRPRRRVASLRGFSSGRTWAGSVLSVHFAFSFRAAFPGTRRESARSIADPRTEIPSTKECLRRGGLSNPAPAILYRRRGSFLIPVASSSRTPPSDRDNRRSLRHVEGPELWAITRCPIRRTWSAIPITKGLISDVQFTFIYGLVPRGVEVPGRLNHEKLTLLGVIVGAALLTATPFSLQTSQKSVVLSLDSAEARVGRPLTAMSVAGVHRRAHRRAYRHGHYYYY